MVGCLSIRGFVNNKYSLTVNSTNFCFIFWLSCKNISKSINFQADFCYNSTSKVIEALQTLISRPSSAYATAGIWSLIWRNFVEPRRAKFARDNPFSRNYYQLTAMIEASALDYQTRLHKIMLSDNAVGLD